MRYQRRAHRSWRRPDRRRRFLTPSKTPSFSAYGVSGVQIWLSGQAGLTGADGDTVATWADQSGWGHDFTISGGQQPIRKLGANGLNSLGVVRFDGGDDRMNGGDLSASFPTAATMFCVAKWRSNDSYMMYRTKANDGWWSFSGTGYFGTFRATRLEATPSGLPTTADVWHLWEITSDSSGYSMWLDRVNKINAASASYDGGNDHVLGHQDGFPYYTPMDIAELVCYDTALGTTNRESVRDQLLTKYALGSVQAGPLAVSAAPAIVVSAPTRNAVTGAVAVSAAASEVVAAASRNAISGALAISATASEVIAAATRKVFAGPVAISAAAAEVVAAASRNAVSGALAITATAAETIAAAARNAVSGALAVSASAVETIAAAVRGAVAGPVSLGNSGELIATQNDQDFETSTGNWSANTGVAIAQSTAQAHGGSASLRLTSNGGVNQNAYYGPAIPITYGKSYKTGAWVYGDGVRQLAIYHFYYTSVGFDGSAGLNLGVLSAGWHYVNFTDAPSDPDWIYARPAFGWTNGDAPNGAVIYVDDVSFREESGALASLTVAGASRGLLAGPVAVSATASEIIAAASRGVTTQLALSAAAAEVVAAASRDARVGALALNAAAAEVIAAATRGVLTSLALSAAGAETVGTPTRDARTSAALTASSLVQIAAASRNAVTGAVALSAASSVLVAAASRDARTSLSLTASASDVLAAALRNAIVHGVELTASEQIAIAAAVRQVYGGQVTVTAGGLILVAGASVSSSASAGPVILQMLSSISIAAMRLDAKTSAALSAAPAIVVGSPSRGQLTGPLAMSNTASVVVAAALRNALTSLAMSGASHVTITAMLRSTLLGALSASAASSVTVAGSTRGATTALSLQASALEVITAAARDARTSAALSGASAETVAAMTRSTLLAALSVLGVADIEVANIFIPASVLVDILMGDLDEQWSAALLERFGADLERWSAS